MAPFTIFEEPHIAATVMLCELLPVTEAHPEIKTAKSINING
jgi:hypothetical protein